MEKYCQEQTVSCEVPGCGVQVKRKQMDKHDDENLKKHVKLLSTQASLDVQTFQVHLPGYEARAADLQQGQELKSAAFSFQGRPFHLEVYPKGLATVLTTIFLESDSEELDAGKLSCAIQAGAVTRTAAADKAFEAGKRSFVCVGRWSAERILSAAQGGENGTLVLSVTLSAPTSNRRPCVIKGYK
uniref:Uncharacterized protein n=1 Tax=Chromera velia CCMP2878 TaxID=1169474 RepID=A0A0G4F330_9ALVE|eukprot:Cvel_14847.t1-p1 / transcript=Cvel_14847.t1 / gene=Cvel_14847 / organism=Chromera_velia_CCMP2878 / gene_product=hypothetical protein / transcript_product=hypothetical protein / location=Cvel_scaffold1072:49419-50447(-) / protein_length=185 / sequence_SO=supercontig / SO=protein_coding / is_pseudo=false